MGVFQIAWIRGMTISNVIWCFRATGVYPIDRRVPLSQLTQETNSIPTHSASTPYVPFCTPRKEGATDDMPAYTELPQPPTFTVDEIERLQARFLESTDSRYALWLETFYPQSHAKARPGILETILRQPPPPAQRKADKYPLNCEQVLTSEQCIREKEEKAEEKKKQEVKEKRMKERKMRREQKAEQKEAAKKKGNAYIVS